MPNEGIIRDEPRGDEHARADYVDELERLNRLYSALSQISQAIVRNRSREDLFAAVCRILVEQRAFCMAWIGLYDPATHRIVPVAHTGDEDGYLNAITIYGDDRPEGMGPTGRAFRERRPYVCNDLYADASTLPFRRELERQRFRASAVFPIREHDRVTGTLNVYADRSGYFRDEEIRLLEGAATDIAFALDSLANEEARRRAEDEQRRTDDIARREQRFVSNLIEAMPGIFYLYDASGRFLRWNHNFERVSGYSGEQIARMHPLDFFADDDKELLEQRIASVFRDGEATVEAAFVSRDGRRVPYFFTGRRIVFDDQPCLAGVGVDISERKLAEERLKELNEQLEEKVAERTRELEVAKERAEAADRLKSAFLATMSHELRTPLNSIIGFTGIILQGLAGPLNPEQSKQLSMVQGSARHLLELINDVLDISKIEAGQLEIRTTTFDLLESVGRAVATLRPLAEKKGLVIDVVVRTPPPPVVGDRRRVEQILLNLLNNAVKFTQRGGVTLAVDAIRAPEAPAGTEGATIARVEVTDTGIGIKREDLARLFQPFRQLDAGLQRQHEGTGLGLAICRRLAGLMGGTIEVRSTWGEGSAFTFDLPVSPA